MKTKNMAKVFACFAVLFCLLAVTSFAAEVKPGLNIFTGTTAKYTFDGDEADISGFNTSGVTVQTYPNDSTGNKALAYTKQHQYIAVKDFPVTEAARPYKVDIDVDYTGQVRFMALEPYDSGLLNCADAIVIYGKTAGKWTSLNYTIKGTQTNSVGVGGFFKTDYQNKPFPNLYVYMFTVLKATDAPTYIDNLSIIPYYGVHFDLNGGVGSTESEYHLSAAGTTYTIKNTGSNIMKPGYTFVGWSDKKDGTKADIITSYTVELGKDIQLYAVWDENPDDTQKSIELYDGETLRTFYVVEEGKNKVLPEFETTADGKVMQGWKTADGNTVYGYNIPVVRESLKLYASYQSFESAPGINMFENGDFEKDGIIDVRPSNGRFTIVSDTDGNRMLEYERGSGYASIQLPVEWEHGRKYKVSYRFKADYAAGTCINMRYDSGANHIIPSSQQGVKENEWYFFETDYVYNNEDHVKHNYDGLNIYYNPNSAGKGGTVYYDDLVFIPYHKITYHANGGTGAPADDFTLAEKYTVSTDTIARPGYIFKGWSLKNGSVNAVTEVETVPGEDIDLYAIWEKAGAEDVIFYDLVSDVPGVANGSINIVCPEEAADYTSVEVYHADSNGIMEGYTPFATMNIENGMAAYAVNGNRSFVAGATRLAFVFKADGMEDITYWYTIPEAHRFDAENHELKYSFWSVSDTHLGGYNADKDKFNDYWNEMSVNRENALKDIFASDADFMFINGDIVNYGPESYANTLEKFIEKRLTNPEWNKNNIPTFLINGNHEYMNTNNGNGGYDFDPIQATFTDYLALVEKNYPDIKITRDEDKMWYAVDIMGAKFIYLSTPEETEAGDTHTYYASARQLKFLEEQLFDGEKSNKTAFVITHVPLKETYKYYKGWEDGISNSAAVEAILARHPNTVVCSGHTHSELAYESEHFVGVGDMTTTFSHFNDGGMVWISAFDGVSGDGAGHIKDYSTGMLVEVYNDVIVIKGREFRENSRFYGHVNYIIPTQDSNVEVEKAEIAGGNPAVGVTLSADIENPDNYTYEWFVNGVKVSTERTWTIDNNPAYGGEYVYLRAIDENGYYVTTKSAVPFNGATVKYDLNGGAGECPETRKVLEGEYLIDNSKFPTKSGHFFIGWSTDKNAVKPMTSLNITEDVTLYAVYTDKPKFYFDANNSGFSPNGVATTATVVDGNLVTVSNGGDQYYTWSNGSFAAADYPYMRIKVKKTEGTNLDGMFFKSDAGGFAENRHIMFFMTDPVALDDGYEVYEFDILSIPEEGDGWYGTISALRYDALSSAGTSYTDYVVFTNKKGIYTIDLTLEDGTNVALPSADSKNFTVSSVKNGSNSVEITLAPAEGYEFTTAEDLMTLAKVNGEAVSDAVIDENGNAVITVVKDLVIVVGRPDSNTIPVEIEFVNSDEATLVVAAYDNNNRFVAAYVDEIGAVNGIKAYVDNTLGIRYLKAFVLGDRTSLNPLSETVYVEYQQPKLKNERIVKMVDVQKNEDEDYYAVYDLFNPYTGAVENDVPGTDKGDKSFTAKWSYGDIVTLESGKVADKSSSAQAGDLLTDTLYWVMDYNKEEGAIEVIEVPADGNEEGTGVVTYRVDVSDAAVTIIGHQASGFNQDMVRWGSLKVADVNKLDGSDKSYLAVNKAYAEDADDTLKTVYGKYVKVYINADWENSLDHTIVDDNGFNAKANFIIVVANSGESANLCNLKK